MSARERILAKLRAGNQQNFGLTAEAAPIATPEVAPWYATHRPTESAAEKAKEDDTTFFSEGVEIHVNKHIAERLRGSTIDFVEGLNDSGFKVSNPNAKGSCGCGKSQSY